MRSLTATPLHVQADVLLDFVNVPIMAKKEAQPAQRSLSPTSALSEPPGAEDGIRTRDPLLGKEMLYL